MSGAASPSAQSGSAPRKRLPPGWQIALETGKGRRQLRFQQVWLQAPAEAGPAAWRKLIHNKFAKAAGNTPARSGTQPGQ